MYIDIKTKFSFAFLNIKAPVRHFMWVFYVLNLKNNYFGRQKIAHRSKLHRIAGYIFIENSFFNVHDACL